MMAYRPASRQSLGSSAKASQVTTPSRWSLTPHDARGPPPAHAVVDAPRHAFPLRLRVRDGPDVNLPEHREDLPSAARHLAHKLPAPRRRHLARQGVQGVLVPLLDERLIQLIVVLRLHRPGGASFLVG